LDLRGLLTKTKVQFIQITYLQDGTGRQNF